MSMAAAALEPDAGGRLEALRQGDERAFLSLVRDLHPSMVRVASLYTGSRAIAEEAVQEAWLGVLRGLAAFEGRSSLRSWVLSIVANCARSRAVREGRHVPFSSLGPEEESGPTVDPSRFHGEDHSRWAGHWTSAPQPFGDEQLAARETAVMIQRAIEGLPERQRAVVTLRDVEGLSSEDACRLLDLSEANQRVLLHRGRAKVRALLEEHLDGGPRA